MKYFSLPELVWSATASQLGLDNTPSAEDRRHLEELVRELLDPLREAWGQYCDRHDLGTPALRVTSGYRGFRLNRAVGGSQTSAHCRGYAADLVPMNGCLPAFKRFTREWLADRPFDQMISERESSDGTPRWVHLGLRSPHNTQSRQLLTMRHGKYLPMTE